MVRTYLNGAQAGLEKSVLDDYGIVCALLHENAHLWCRAPWAVPIRLVVKDDQAEQAARILNGDAEAAAEIEEGLEAGTMSADVQQLTELPSGNPWELLVIAFYFFLPGICVLQFKYPTLVRPVQLENKVMARVLIAHFLGWLAITFAGLLVAIYFRVRFSNAQRTAHDQQPTTES